MFLTTTDGEFFCKELKLVCRKACNRNTCASNFQSQHFYFGPPRVYLQNGCVSITGFGIILNRKVVYKFLSTNDCIQFFLHKLATFF